MPATRPPPSHAALGDALATAGIFAALVPRLREADVRTLGEAEAFAARHADLVRREVVGDGTRCREMRRRMRRRRPPSPASTASSTGAGSMR